MGQGRRQIASQIKQRAIHETKRHAPSRRGMVTHLKPLTVKVFEYDELLVYEEDFHMSQWALWYQQQIGFRKDDVVIMHHDDEWVLHDVVTDTPLKGLLNGSKGKSGTPGTSGTGTVGFPSRVRVVNHFTGLTPHVETLVRFSTPGQAHMLFSVEVNHACRTRLYAEHSKAVADLSRSEYYDPGVDVACLLELVFIDSTPQLILSPTATLVEQDKPYSKTFSGIVRLDDDGFTSLTVTLDGYPIQP
jgi:hypothetical protein